MTHVLIVDDSPDNLLITSALLVDQYQVDTVSSGEACIEFCRNQVPNAIVLDVDMPGMNGYQTCQALRQEASTATVPVIFVTGMDSEPERLQGYESGGNAYLIKPANKEDLVYQIERSQLTQRLAQQARLDADNAMNVAMEAMTASSELGEIIEFVKQVQDSQRRVHVAQRLLESVANFGLSISVFMPQAREPFVGCHAQSVEAQLLRKAQQQPGRILNYGIRTIVKSDLLVILVKNMPINDEAKYGRFNDHLAVLLTIAEGRLLAIQASQATKHEQLSLLDQVIQRTQVSVDAVNQALEQHDQRVRAVMLNMITDLEAMLFRLGLEEDQEETLVTLAYDANTKLQATDASKRALMETTGSIVAGLQSIRQTIAGSLH